MTPCRPATRFCSIVGQASFQTAGLMGPSMRERSNGEAFLAGAGPDMNAFNRTCRFEAAHGGADHSGETTAGERAAARALASARGSPPPSTRIERTTTNASRSQRPHQRRRDTRGPPVAHHHQRRSMTPAKYASKKTSLVCSPWLDSRGPRGRFTARRALLEGPGSTWSPIRIPRARIEDPASARTCHTSSSSGLLGALHDEAKPRRRILAHQLVDDAIGHELILHVDAQQTARPRVERRFPQHLRHHLAQAFEPRDLGRSHARPSA